MIKKIIKVLIQILNILFIFLSIFLLFVFIFKKEWFEIFIEWMKIKIHWFWYWNYLIIFLSSCIESFPVLWVLFPWQNILLIVWWFFWHISKLNLIYVVIVASIWAMTWNYIWYFLWKYYWDWFFQKYWLWIWIWQTEVKYLKEWVNKWWPWWIIFWKFHPMTRSFLPFIIWSMWMKQKKFMIYNSIGSIIRATTIILLWSIFIKYYKIILEHSWTISIIILLIIWLFIYKFKKEEFKKYWKEKNAEIEEMSKIKKVWKVSKE